jgi:hypothetical protein
MPTSTSTLITLTATRNASTPVTDPTPWWKYRMVWLVIGGPLAVVVASFVTLWLAIKYPDPVLEVSATTTEASQLPAVQARNHAATGGVK